MGCKICEFPNVKKFERELRAGVNYAQLERKWSVCFRTIKRHELEHMAIGSRQVARKIPLCQTESYSVDDAPVLDINNMDKFLEHWCKEATEMFYKAKVEDDPYQKGQALKHIKSFAKLSIEAHEIVKDVAVKFNWKDVMPNVLSAAREYPEASVAISEAFKQKKLGR